MLDKSNTRKVIKQVRDDSSSLYVHRDAMSFRSYYTDSLSKLSLTFTFDRILLGSDVYQRIFRGSLKESLRQKQFEVQSWKKNSEIEKLLRSSRQQSLQEIKVLLAGDCETRQSVLASILDGYGFVSTKDSSEWCGRVKRLAVARLSMLIDYMASAETLPEGVDPDGTKALYQRIAACDETGSDICLASAVGDFLDTTQWQALLRQFQSEIDEPKTSFEQVQ